MSTKHGEKNIIYSGPIGDLLEGYPSSEDLNAPNPKTAEYARGVAHDLGYDKIKSIDSGAVMNILNSAMYLCDDAGALLGYQGEPMDEWLPDPNLVQKEKDIQDFVSSMNIVLYRIKKLFRELDIKEANE